MEITYRYEPNFLFVELCGEWRTEDMKHAIEAVRDNAVQQGLTRLCIDARKVLKPDYEMIRFYTGEHIARIWHQPFRTAVVVIPEIYNRFGETVAVNRAAVIACFFEEKDALGWLLQGGEAGGR